MDSPTTTVIPRQEFKKHWRSYQQAWQRMWGHGYGKPLDATMFYDDNQQHLQALHEWMGREAHPGQQALLAAWELLFAVTNDRQRKQYRNMAVHPDILARQWVYTRTSSPVAG